MSVNPLPSTGPHRPSLVGRERELATLRDALDAAVAGTGCLVLIGGEAGIGKTTLVHSLMDDAAARGARTPAGACYDLEVTPPYGPWIAPLRTLAEDIGSEDLLSMLGGTGVDAPSATLEAFFEAVWAAIQRSATQQPLVLIFEDMHWTDPASLDLLRFVARRVYAQPILIVLTFRDVELQPDQPLYRMQPHFVRESRAVRLAIRRLERSAIAELLSIRYGLSRGEVDSLADYLDRYGDGNPFFVNELLYMLEVERRLQQDDAGWRLESLAEPQVPPLLRQVIDVRLDRLDHEAYQLLQVAAVIGAEVPIDLWAEVGMVTAERLTGVIESALAAHILIESRDQRGYQFAHALIREALVSSLVLPRRRDWNRRIAQTLARRPDVDPDAVAHHLWQADDPLAAGWLVQAAIRATRRNAWLMAAERLERALTLRGRIAGTDREQAWLLLHIGRLYRRSRLIDGLLAMEKSHAIALDTGDPLLIGFTTALLGLLRCSSGSVNQGLGEIQAGVDILERWRQDHPDARITDEAIPALLPDPAAVPGVYINWLAAAGRLQETIERGEAFLARIPEQPPHPALDDYYDACIGLGRAYTMLGRPADARQMFDRARVGYSAVEQMPWIYYLDEIRYLMYFALDDVAERARVEDLVANFLRRSELDAFPDERNAGTRQSLRLLLLNGRWDLLDVALPPLGHRTVGLTVISIEMIRVELMRARGDSSAERYLHELIRDHHGATFGDVIFPNAIDAHRLAADLALDAGHLDDAARWLDMLEAWLDRSGAVIGRVDHLLARARHALIRGDLPASRSLAERALEEANQPRQPLRLIHARRALARIANAEQNWNAALEHLAVAEQLATACDTPFERAQALLIHAETAAGLRDLATVRRLHSDVRAICEPLQAAPILAEVAAIEQRLDGEPVPDASGIPLSPREIDVLRLVAQGYTDAEVARRLFISPRTVSGHLQSIYNKLGVSSRTAAAAFAFEHGLA